MLVTSSNIREIDRGVKKMFDSGRGRAEVSYKKIATVTPSTHESEIYPLKARNAGMREWIGPRVAKQLKNYDYVLINKTYEDTLEIPVNAIEDDTVGVYGNFSEDMGYNAEKWPDDLVIPALQAGKVGTGFDGVAFFATTHNLDPSGNQANLFTSTALSAANLNTVQTAMRTYTGEDGRMMNVRPMTLVIPPSLRRTAREIVAAELVGGGDSNVDKGAADILVIDELENEPTTWYLMDLSRPIKPMIFQQRQAPAMTSRTSMDSDNVFLEDVFQWGSKARGVAGYGPWWLAARCEA